jgi:hypothetical protein
MYVYVVSEIRPNKILFSIYSLWYNKEGDIATMSGDIFKACDILIHDVKMDSGHANQVSIHDDNYAHDEFHTLRSLKPKRAL